jgi:type II secretory pathway pseudopilin PulG
MLTTFPQGLRRARALTRREDGQTLIEMLVVILVIGVLIGAGATFIIGQFNANARSFQLFQQETALQQTNNFLNARLSAMSFDEGSQDSIGTTLSTGEIDVSTGETTSVEVACSSSPNQCINPLSVAGDQLVFRSQGVCYRVFYVSTNKQLDVAIAAPAGSSPNLTCTGSAIDPVRGPNEPLPSGNVTSSVCSDTSFDPVLDDPYHSLCGSMDAAYTSGTCSVAHCYTVSVLADNVVAAPPPGAAPTVSSCSYGAPPDTYPTLATGSGTSGTVGVFTYCATVGVPTGNLTDPVPALNADSVAPTSPPGYSPWYTDDNTSSSSDIDPTDPSTCPTSDTHSDECIEDLYLTLYLGPNSTSTVSIQNEPFQSLISIG